MSTKKSLESGKPTKRETHKDWANTAHCTTHSEKACTAKPGRTRITIKYDVGFQNAVYLRGDGPDLSWNRGIKLKNVKADEWVWETDRPFKAGEFKVLVNDTHFEQGENHRLVPGAHLEYTPRFDDVG